MARCEEWSRLIGADLIFMKARYAAFALALALGATSSLHAGQSPKGSRRDVESAAAAARERALQRAQVWIEPSIRIDRARLADNPAGSHSFAVNAVVPCRFKPGGIGGNSKKFDCVLQSGEKIRVKYGRDNAEVFAEVIASRLLSALGFPTDRMYVVDRIRCTGCPEDPFSTLQCMNDGSSYEQCFSHIDYSQTRDFDAAVIERPLPGRRIETRKAPGWTWEELSKIDPAAGGASRAQVDALRLMAVFLSHWDNKSGNQRLLCLDAQQRAPGTKTATKTARKSAAQDDARECHRSLAMVQDLGGTFGPAKLDLTGWRSTPIWAESASCRVSMHTLPYEGSTFPDINISEPGRAFLAARLRQLTASQVHELFEGARLSRYAHQTDEGKQVENWVKVFNEKVSAIADHPGCPGDS
jgi:hypothetical protein